MIDLQTCSEAELVAFFHDTTPIGYLKEVAKSCSGPQLMRATLVAATIMGNARTLEVALLDAFPELRTVEAAPAVQVGTTQIPVTVMDIVRLRPKLSTARSLLNTYGEWWKIVRGYSSKTSGEQWGMRSLTKREHGLTNVMAELYIKKVNDPNYEIVNCCPALQEFNPKNYE